MGMPASSGYRRCQAWATASGSYRPQVRSVTGEVDIPLNVVNPVVPIEPGAECRLSPTTAPAIDGRTERSGGETLLAPAQATLTEVELKMRFAPSGAFTAMACTTCSDGSDEVLRPLWGRRARVAKPLTVYCRPATPSQWYASSPTSQAVPALPR